MKRRNSKNRVANVVVYIGAIIGFSILNMIPTEFAKKFHTLNYLVIGALVVMSILEIVKIRLDK